MSMNDVEQMLQVFLEDLERFNQDVQQSLKEVDSCHQSIDSIWQDTMRQRYDHRWQPLQQQLQDYDTRISLEYTDLIGERLAYLRRYLYGN